MLQDINLNLYKTFYNVAITKSFKLASEKMYISQPAISKQIKKLEEILDTKLFYRFSKGVELTKEGKVLFEQLEKMLFYLEGTINYFSSSKDLMNGELKIGCQSHIMSFYLINYVEKFRKDYPGIKIKIISDSTSSLIELLFHHKIDFIVDSYPIDIQGKEIVKKEIAKFETILISNNAYDYDIKVINDLNGKNFILPSKHSSMRKNLENELYKFNLDFEVGLEVDTTDLIINSVKRNLGIGYVVKEAVVKELNNQELKKINIRYELPKLELDLVYFNNYLSYPAKIFLKNYIKKI